MPEFANLFRTSADWIRRIWLGRSDKESRGNTGSIKTLADETSARLDARRAALRSSGFDTADMPDKGTLGLCLSGGGIRSATISLGVVQALASGRSSKGPSANRLFDFDYLSTVSGGGYIGSFLGSLFLDSSARGLDGRAAIDATNSALKNAREFGEQALTADARRIYFPSSTVSGEATGNPVWWLREHSRYLAPNGPTDYLTAATVLIRNWLAMISVFALPIAAIFLAVVFWELVAFDWLISKLESNIGASSRLPQLGQLLDRAALAAPTSGQFTPSNCCGLLSAAPSTLSPLFILAAGALVLGLAAGFAFWWSEWLPAGAQWAKKSFSRVYTRSSFLFGVLGSTGALIFAWRALGSQDSGPNAIAPAALCWLQIAILFGLLAAAVALGIATRCWLREFTQQDFTVELRRLLTRFGAQCLLLTLILGGLGVIDSIAGFIHRAIESKAELLEVTAGQWIAFTSAFSPMAAWLISQIPKWFEDRGGRIFGFLRNHYQVAALVVGIALYSILALYVDLAIKILVFEGVLSGGERGNEIPTAAMLAALVALFMMTTGGSSGFINLSSVHGLYAARLTRAYLGATNRERLKRSADSANQARIHESHPKDDVDIKVYQRASTVGPLHLINVTLNETRNRQGSQLVERDRKGVPIVFAPEGLLLDAAREDRIAKRSWFSWDELKDVEALSLGQLCAISGAAASPGMGAMSSLGASLTLSFANVRLGYWWKVKNLLRERVEQPRDWVGKLTQRLILPFGTFCYLVGEMIGSFSRDRERVYLSDGGHFDNSGAYELLRREVPVIVVCDNGADPDYSFSDLENLIRKARVDLGISLNVASPSDVKYLFDKQKVRGSKRQGAGSACFLNLSDGDWRNAAREAGGPAVALLLNGYVRDPVNGHQAKLKHRIVWIKPQVFDGLPHDVVGYARANRPFPQQSTINQFFDEEQWESYRALGYAMVMQLFRNCDAGHDVFRVLARDLKP